MKSSSSYKNSLAFSYIGYKEKILLKAKRKNTALFINKLKKNKINLIQEEIGESIWFGFNFITDPNHSKNGTKISDTLYENGYQYRPIFAVNFINKDAMKFFNNEVHSQLVYN